MRLNLKTPTREAAGGKPRKGPFKEPGCWKTGPLLGTVWILALALRFLHFRAISQTVFPRIPLLFTDSDMYATWQWAQTILAGDILGRATYHPYFNWMREMAPLETWYHWWGSKEIFQQAPFYPYWVAGLLAVSRSSLTFVLFAQLVVGAFQPLVMFWLGRRLFDERAGILAAALTAAYGPFVFQQGTLLRDWLPPILDPLAMLLLLRARVNGRGRDGFLSGVALGVALLTKESALLFLPAAGLWMLWGQGWVCRRDPIRPGALFLAGLLLSLSPLFIRNAVVGAPVLALSNRGVEAFVLGNAADGYPVGNQWPGSMKRILENSDGRSVKAIHETLMTYEGNWLKFLNHQFMRFRGLLDPLEVPNNLSFYYGLEISPVLRFMPGYGLILPLGLAGLVVSITLWRRHLLLILYALSVTIGLMGSIIIGRNRLILVPVLILYGAAGLGWLFKSVQKKAIIAGVGYLALLVSVAVMQQFVLPLSEVRDEPLSAPIHGGLEYNFSARIYASDGRFEHALMELDRLTAKSEQNPKFVSITDAASQAKGSYYAEWADQLLKSGKRNEAKRRVEQARSKYSAYLYLGTPNYNLAVLYYRLRETERAKLFFRRFLELEPEGPRAVIARRILSRLEGAQ